VSDPNRNVLASVAYAPYGEQYLVSTPFNIFTGQRPDTVGDVVDFPDRRYHATQGRWLSPDPAGLAAADPSNPQSWNRYAYVLNNPTTLIDPLGLDNIKLQAPGIDSGGMNCTLNGIAIWCAVAGSAVGSGGAANVTGLPSWINKAGYGWVPLRAYADDSIGYVTNQFVGWSPLDIVRALALQGAGTKGKPIDPATLTGTAKDLYERLRQLGIKPADITIYGSDEGHLSVVLTPAALAILQSNVTSHWADNAIANSWFHPGFTNSGRDSETTKSLHVVWVDSAFADYAGLSGVYVQLHFDQDNPFGGFAHSVAHTGCALLHVGCGP
jgi:RHS repeat-associated protein